MSKELKKSRNNKGFTIIETLVAITVLMIAIAGPLVMANKSLAAALYAKDQMEASYLAQEGMEYLRNLKDNNIAAGRDWLSNICGNNDNESCVRSNGQNNKQSTLATPDALFTRIYYVTLVQQGVNQNNATEVAVTVEVSWSEGIVSNATKITSEMTNKNI